MDHHEPWTFWEAFTFGVCVGVILLSIVLIVARHL